MNALTPLKKYRFKVIAAPAIKVVECLIQLATPFLVRYMIDVGIASGDIPYVLKLGGILLALSIVAFIFTMIAQYLASRVSADYGYDLRNDLYARFLNIKEKDLESFGKNKTMTIFTNDVNALQNGVMMFMRLILRPPFLVIGAVVLSFIVAPIGGYVVLGAAILSSLVIALVVILSPKRYGALQNDLDQISLIGNDILTGARPIRAFGKEEKEAKRFDKANSSYQKHGVKVVLLNALVNPLTFFFINLGIILIAYFGGLRLANGSLTSGQLASLISYLTLLLQAIVMFSRMIVSLNRARVSYKRVNSFLEIPSIKEENKEHHLVDDENIISFKNVSFAYHKSSSLLEDINLLIKKGTTVGFIGPTGSGKSTILSLIEKTYEVDKGEIYFAGVEYKDLEANFIHQRISYVSQKPSIFAGSIRSNLLLAKPNASEKEMIKALKEAEAYEFVSKYEDGLDHIVEESGNNLSGGQKQRLLIARAFLKEAEVLILDDSMSALDYLSERKIKEALRKKEGQTKILVSQRVTSLMDVDEIFVMDNGRIIDHGKHQELLNRCAIYRDIYKMQVSSK